MGCAATRLVKFPHHVCLMVTFLSLYSLLAV
jgi:hypothetical protein